LLSNTGKSLSIKNTRELFILTTVVFLLIASAGNIPALVFLILVLLIIFFFDLYLALKQAKLTTEKIFILKSVTSLTSIVAIFITGIALLPKSLHLYLWVIYLIIFPVFVFKILSKHKRFQKGSDQEDSQ